MCGWWVWLGEVVGGATQGLLGCGAGGWTSDLKSQKYTMARQLVEMLPYTVYYSLISLKV